MKPQEELVKICKELGYDINNLTEYTWGRISEHQTLSESLIKEYKELLDGWKISCHQCLSESFIEQHKEWLDVFNISKYQRLSEPFIERNKEWLDAFSISKYQRLSEPFIERNKEWLNMRNIVMYQKLSDNFIEKNKLKVDKNSNTLYWNTTQKIELLKRKGWKIDKDGYVIAYKRVRKNRKSMCDDRITYHVGETYTSRCDCNLYEEKGFGISALSYSKAKKHDNALVIKVRFQPEWLGAITQEGKLRLHKIEVLS